MAKIRVVPASEIDPAKGLKAESYVDERVMPSGLTSEQKAAKLFKELDAATIELLTRKHKERVQEQLNKEREESVKKAEAFKKWVKPLFRPLTKDFKVTLNIPVTIILDYQSLDTDVEADAAADSRKLNDAVMKATKEHRKRETKRWHDFLNMAKSEGAKRGLQEAAVERILGDLWDELRE